MSDESALKPLLDCPFCGGKAALNTIKYDPRNDIVRLNGQDVFHGVNCISCGADTRGIVGSKTQEEAAAKWNRRAI